MSSDPLDPRLKNLVRFYHRRNGHLTATHDAEDLFQDAWINLNRTESDTQSPENQLMSRDQLARRAVRLASDRAFGKLRKRWSRGSASETALEFDPADCLPDADMVIDLRNQIRSLPTQERVVIELTRLGYRGNEIADQLELSPQAVTRFKQKAIRRLRHALGCES